MSLLDLASLVLAPTATKEGKVYSAIPDTGDGDMTFTRGSAATRVNSAGLIEKERGNLLLQSNSFDTTWVNTNVSVTGGQSGYDGSSDAWKVDISSSFAQVEQSISSSGVQTFSVYAKAGSLNWVRLRVDHSTFSGTYFDLQNGLVGTTASDIYSTIEDVGSGWYRCSLSYNNNITKVRIYPAQADNDLTATSGNIYIQDAMLNEGLVAQPYIETTTTAVYEGITDDVPRVDYSGGGCPSLLLEPSRTNLITQSEFIGSTDWDKTGGSVTVTSNATTSPEGVQNASKLTGVGTSVSYILTRQTITLPAADDYTMSGYFKYSNNDWIFIGFTAYDGGGGAYFNINSGEVGNVASGCTASIEAASNGWYRCVVTAPIGASDLTGRPSVYVSYENGTTDFPTVGEAQDQAAFVYGVQVERGSYVSSYINSYGTSTTRVQDYCVKTGISDLIGQTEGTFFAEFKHNGFNGAISQNALYTRAASSTSNYLYINVYNGRINIGLRVNSTTLFDTLQGPNPLSEGVHKCAFAYKSGDIVIYLDGQNIYVPSNNVYSNLSLDELGIGNNTTGGNQLGDGINQALVFKTRLSNDELAELTKL